MQIGYNVQASTDCYFSLLLYIILTRALFILFYYEVKCEVLLVAANGANVVPKAPVVTEVASFCLHGEVFFSRETLFPLSCLRVVALRNHVMLYGHATMGRIRIATADGAKFIEVNIFAEY